MEKIKKALKFVFAIVVVSSLILWIIGLSQLNWKNERKKEPLKKDASEQFKEVRIVAVKEKAPPPIPKEVKPKRKSSKKTESTAARANPQKKNPGKRTQTKKKMVKTAFPKTLQKKNQRSKRLDSAKFRMNHQMIDSGRQLIDKKTSVPIVLASYDRIGFEAYLNKMNELGGRLYVGDAYRKKILAEVIVLDGDGNHAFSGFDFGNMQRLQSLALFRPREITGEPLINEIVTNARKLFKDHDLRCVVLLPLDTEAAFLGALKKYLTRNGYGISEFDVFWGTYFDDGLQFGLKVEKGRMRSTQDVVYLDMVLSM